MLGRPASSSEIDSNSSLPERSLILAGIFASSVAAAIAVIALTVRAPLGGPFLRTFAVVFLYLFTVVAVALAQSLRRVEPGTTPYRSFLLMTVAVLFLPVFALPFGSYSGPVFVGALALALAYALPRIQAASTKLHWGETAGALVLGLAIGCVLFFIVNSWGYANVFSPEQTLTGVQWFDTLYHAVLANALVNYGTVSTMADGVPFAPYHFLSHLLLGSLGHALGVTAIDSYFLGLQIVLVPLLLFTLPVALLNLCPRLAQQVQPMFWFLVPLTVLAASDLVGITTYLISESYVLSLILLFWTLPLLVEWIDRAGDGPSKAALASAVMMAVLVGLAKISVGAVLLTAIAGLYLRLIGITVRNSIIYGIPILAVAIVIVAITRDLRSFHNVFQPLQFVRDYGRVAIGTMILIPFLWCAAYFQIRNADNRDRIVAELFSFIALVSIAPALLLSIGGGASGYFSGVGNWSALLFLSGMVILPQLRSIHRPTAFAVGITAILFALTALNSDKRHSFNATLQQYKKVQEKIAKEVGSVAGADKHGIALFWSAFGPNHSDRHALRDALRLMPGYRMVQALHRAGVVGRNDVAVFVPPANRAYWTLNWYCLSEPFLVPAMTGLPLIKGLQPREISCGPPGRYPDRYDLMYGEEGHSADVTDAALCDHARRRGFFEIAALTSVDSVRRISCRTAAR